MEEPQNPWITKSGEVVYQNPWIQVSEFQVINPKGNPGIYGVVHFKNRAIGIIPYDDDGNLVLVGQYRYPLSLYSWEIPEGGGKMEEDPMQAGLRELKEETGLEAGHCELILTMHLSNSVSDEIAYIYLARNLQQGIAEPEETEELQIQKVSLEEAYQRVLSGEITDSLSVAGILRLQLMKLEHKL